MEPRLSRVVRDGKNARMTREEERGRKRVLNARGIVGLGGYTRI